MVKIKTGMAIDGQRNFKGLLRGIEGDDITIEFDGKQVSLPLASIEKARLMPDFN